MPGDRRHSYIQPGDRSILPGERSIHPGDRSIHPGDRSIHPGERSINPGERSIHPGERSNHPGDRSTCASIRQSVKRCLSPGWSNIAPEDANNKVKRQQKNNMNNQMVVMVGKGQGSSDRTSDGQEDTTTDLIGSFGKTTVCSPTGNNPSPSVQTDLIGSFGKTTSEDQGYDEPASICPPAPAPCFMRKDSLPSATSRQINSDILDTYSSSLPVLDTYSSSLPVLDSYSSLDSPFIFPLPASLKRDVSSCSLSLSARSYSTSYTSWTAPLVGHSDSCVPGSSILDGGGSTAPAGGLAETCGRMSRAPGRKMSSGRGKRDCSADTSKDIDDIDDFDLDELEELKSDGEEALIEEEGGTKRWEDGSPDLAYGSMNGLCEDEQQSM